jgi:hypothetical protein
MKGRFKLYGEFQKVEEQEDGTLKVSGIASSEAVDSDGEIITAEAMKAAIPDYMAFGAVREMHTSWAAGTALKCEVNDQKQTEFECLVVDGEAIKKVQAGVYKGFSIGGRVTKRDPLNKSTIQGIKLVEVSLVDRPANPDAVFSMGKVEGDEPESTVGTLRKGLYTVASFADTLQSLAWLARGTAEESEYEGDNSPIPAAFGAWVADGLALLQAMTAEEVAELIACLPKPEQVSAALAMAEGTDGLEKKGAKFSAATVADLTEKMQAACEHHVNLGKAMADLNKVWTDAGVKDEDGGADGDSGAAKLAKAETDEALQKAQALTDDLAKATESLTKLSAENETLTKRVKELEAMPAALKGVSVVIDADKQSEMFHEQAADEKAADLKKCEDATATSEERFLATTKFIHKYGHKPA